MAPWVLSSSNVSLEGTEIRVKSPFPFVIACYVEGRPKPKITWLKDGENIDEIIENNDENFVITIASLTIIVIISFSFVIILVIRNKKYKNLRNDMRQLQLLYLRNGNVGKLNKECTIEEQAELLPYCNSFEVERENITLGKQLGAGAFGRVLLAQVKGLNEKESPTRVAVKMCKFGHDKEQLRALIMELKIMIHLGKHLNIVNLLGAHTSNIDRGELWILVEYCKYGNLLKFIQRCKAQFINQIYPVTSEIDVGRTSPFPNDPLSATSLGCSIEYEKTSNSNPDSHLDLHPGSSIEIGQSMGRHPSTTSNIRLTTEKNSYCNSSALPSGGRHNVLPPTNPTPRKESSISDSDYDFTYSLFLNSDMAAYSQPPSSPASSSTSDCQEKKISSDAENIPGVSAPLTTTDLLCWAWQVANGMEYLTSRKVLHGDLAARNLLLASNNVVKICDFGLSRKMYTKNVYLKKSNEMMPIKWMAPEAIEQRIFSIQSDVWSYGVTLWEMFTLGNTPFPGVPLNKLGTALVKGMRLEKPKYCNDQIYSLLLQCWRSNPVERPRFNQIVDILSDMLSPDKTKCPMSEEGVSLDYNDSFNSEQSQSRPIIDGGYLDVKFVRKQKPKSTSTFNAPSTQSQGPNNV
ncbi:Platelet-derived growth factor receptor alpha [Armadillidium vulgare]|nr:Platelet-derived growth factor receptor alpha [Armadillidium vulgare]